MEELEKPPPELKKRALSNKQLLLHNFSFGQTGETRASRYLIARGYLVLGMNLQVGQGEIDILALDPKQDEVVLIEVKTRSTRYFGDPSTAVNHRKLSALKKALPGILKHFSLEKDYRFDIISVLPQEIEHFENVTW